LHIDKALDVMNLHSSAIPRQPMRVLKYGRGFAKELLTRCKYFQVERMLLNTETTRSLVPFQTSTNSFHGLLIVDGCGNISWDEGAMNFFKGDCIFVPAESVPLLLHGKAQLLDVSC
jgi:mannose-6-phosphate isomerase